MNTTAGTIAALVVAGACSSDHHAAPDGAIDDAAVDTPVDHTVDVAGTGQRLHVTDSGNVMTPRDFTSDPVIAALTPDGTGYVRRDGTGASGTFTVPVGADAPSWLLEVRPATGASTFIDSSEHAPDLGDVVGGRPDAVDVTQPTPITLQATNLATWQDTDILEVVASNLGVAHFDVEIELDNALVAGATTIDGASFDWSSQSPSLIDGTKGDVAKLLQLSTTTVGPTTYQTLSRIASLPTFTQVDGQTHTATVALSAVAANKTLTALWSRSKYAAFKSLVGPGATDGQQLLAIDTLPNATTLGFYANAPDLVLFSTTGTDDSSQQFAYGNPFQADEWLISYYAFDVPVLAAGASAPFDMQAGVFEDRVIENTTLVLDPKVSPVRNPKLGGADLFTPHTGVGATPVISWDAPAMGPPTSYSISVFRVDANNGGTKVTRTGTLVTTATSLRIPPGVLTQGSSFVMSISADLVPSATAAKPFRAGLPDARSTVITAQFQP